MMKKGRRMDEFLHAGVAKARIGLAGAVEAMPVYDGRIVGHSFIFNEK